MVGLYLLGVPLGILLVSLVTVAALRLRAEGARSSLDTPGLLLGWAVRRLPHARRDWGVAMTAELAEVSGAAARWRFALGCVPVALFSPRRGGASVAVVGVLAAAAVVVTGLSVGQVLPSLQIFAVTLVALFGAGLLFNVARSRRLGSQGPGLALTSLIVAGVIGCIGLVAYVVAVYPVVNHPVHGQLSDGRRADHLVVLAVLLTGYLWLALTPPRGLVTDRTARRLGIAAGLLFGGGYLAATISSYAGGFAVLFFVPMVMFLLVSAIAAAIGGSVRAGLQAALWGGLLTALLAFAIPVLTTLNRVQVGASIRDDFEAVTPYDLDIWFSSALGQGLGFGIFGLLMFPVWALFLGLIGSALGKATAKAA